ncbi:MAG: prepilin-type N-terminal cleavage/methylation domain-containing protein [Lachnospiraceae bacterium]|nr:prepilin-type N-terminal cleavage/methylation domain-containing protein [Lachnospiraceae bacterium]
MGDKRGETLIELVVSLALFALVITMLVTVFNASANSLATNVETKRMLNQQEVTLAREDDVIVEELSIQSTIRIGADAHVAGEVPVQRLRPVNGSLYKFRPKTD